MDELAHPIDEDDDREDGPAGGALTVAPSANPAEQVCMEWVQPEQACIIQALKEGLATEADVFVRVRDLLGKSRLTKKLHQDLQSVAAGLVRRKLIAAEDNEYFLLPAGRDATLVTRRTTTARRQGVQHRFRPLK